MALVFEPQVVDERIRGEAVAQARKLKLELPTFSQLAGPPAPSSEFWNTLSRVPPVV